MHSSSRSVVPRIDVGSRRSIASALVLAALLFSGCSDSPTAPTTRLPPRHVDLSEEWLLADPAAVGFDRGRLEAALEAARDVEHLSGLVIVRDGYLVHEEYHGRQTRESLADVRSVTKSIVSTLVGIAIREGVFRDVNQPIGELLPSHVAPLTEDKRAITIEHLLTMTAGFDWFESGAVGYNDWINANDHVRYLTDRPLRDPPGTVFIYNSAAVHLLSVLLAEASGTTLPSFAREHLFDLIGIDTVAWEPLPSGYVNGGSGIDLRLRDLARMGQLLLQEGTSGERQVVPEAWLTEAATPRFSGFGASAPIRSLNYGYLWWIEEAQPRPGVFAWGYGGQFLYVVPEVRLVVVATTDWRAGSTGPAERELLRVIVDEIVLAALRVDDRLLVRAGDRP